MYNFFVDKPSADGRCFVIAGNDFNHIKNVLRMKEGEQLLVSCDGTSSLCKIAAFEGEAVIAEIVESNYNDTSLPIDIYLFQGLPKSDKLEFIIQKAVELGACRVIPVEMERSIVKIEDKKKAAKIERWQAIAESAAKQSKRNTIPTVGDILPYKAALEAASSLDILLVPYESEIGMESTRQALASIKSGMSVGILIGPEGGFSDKEIEEAKAAGGNIISLGKRILRCETAAVCALSMCMLHSEINNIEKEG